jgi:HSP20 family protein
MEQKKRSFFERLTGSYGAEEETGPVKKISVNSNSKDKKNDNAWMEAENEEAELTVDVYQTPDEIIVQTMVAGVKPEDLEIITARDILTIRGKREENRNVEESNFFAKELYWGSFSRTISLPSEVEPEEAEATEKHGLLTIKLKKVDKEKKNNIKIKSI